MRRLTVLLTALLFTGFMILSCSDSGTGPDPDNGGNGDNGGSETTTYTVDVTASPSEGGSISPEGGTYDEGEDIELQADPNEGYVFSGWTGDLESSDNPLSLTVDQNYSLTGNFEKKSYPLTTNTEGEGAVDEEIVEEKSTDYEHGTVVELTANPAEGYRFVEWQGDVTGTENPAQVTVDESKEVTAVFEKKSYSLTTNIEGEGAVNEETVEEKSTDYEHGTVVELTANPAEGYKFVEWQGDLTGTDNPTQITVDNPKEVTAVFERKSYSLTTNIEGEGAVAEEVVQAKDYSYGTVVELTADPAEGGEFIEWQGAMTGTENPAQITIDEAKEVTAVFEKKSYTLAVNISGNGSVTKTPDQSMYEYGTTVELEAIPADGYEFLEWTGAIASTDNPVEVTVNEETQLTAAFEEKSSFYLGENGVTVKCEDASVGDTGTVNGVTYTKRSKSQITPSNAPTTCTSGITNMEELFSGASSFNGDISHWDVSAVTDMSRMFYEASSFNRDINSWDVSSVENMFGMFQRASNFNGNISDWDVSSVTHMNAMFDKAFAFNSDISGWDVSSVTDMDSMFSETSSFNRDISSWNVSSVTDMGSMFYKASAFNGSLNSWDVSNVTRMRFMFSSATSFNRDLSDWELTSLNNMSGMFLSATSFNQDLNSWNVTSVTDMSSMFAHATDFNGDISGWSVGNVEDLSGMFSGADSFNGDVSGWDVSSVTDMGFMFAEATSFNQDIGDWDVSTVDEMSSMFEGASSFNQDISGWCVPFINSSERDSFATGSALIDEHKPVWGTCPE